VRGIRRRTRRKFAPEEKVRIVLDGLRGEQSISDLCRREGIASNLYYRWSKDFLEAGKKQLAGDTLREATSDEVKELRAENREGEEPSRRAIRVPCAGKIRGGARAGDRRVNHSRLLVLHLNKPATRQPHQRRHEVSG
jgi:transposase